MGFLEDVVKIELESCGGDESGVLEKFCSG